MGLHLPGLYLDIEGFPKWKPPSEKFAIRSYTAHQLPTKMRTFTPGFRLRL